MKRCLLTLIAVSLMAGASCQQETVSEGELKALLEKSLKVWNEGDLSLVDDVYSSQYVYHKADGADLVGLEALKEEIKSTRAGIPDFKIAIDELIINGNKIATRYTMTGTNTGPLGGLPPTGKKFKVSGANITDIVDGKLREDWEFYNMASMLVQLGFRITPPAE